MFGVLVLLLLMYAGEYLFGVCVLFLFLNLVVLGVGSLYSVYAMCYVMMMMMCALVILETALPFFCILKDYRQSTV